MKKYLLFLTAFFLIKSSFAYVGTTGIQSTTATNGSVTLTFNTGTANVNGCAGGALIIESAGDIDGAIGSGNEESFTVTGEGGANLGKGGGAGAQCGAFPSLTQVFPISAAQINSWNNNGSITITVTFGPLVNGGLCGGGSQARGTLRFNEEAPGNASANGNNCSNVTFSSFGYGQAQNIPVSANTYYDFTWNQGSASMNSFCADPNNSPASFNGNQTCWFSSNATNLRVYANHSNNTYSTNSSTLTYRKTTPTVNAGADQNTCNGVFDINPTVSCANVTTYARVGGTGSVNSSGVTSGVPANSSITVRVTANNSGCTAIDDVIIYNRTPTAVSVSGGGNVCGSTTITASGGAGGTIYYQGTSSNGTSTANASTSETITTSGTYYFRARSSTGCWGAPAGVTVNVSSGLSATAVVTPSPCAGGCEASVDFEISGGIAPYTLNEFWEGFDGTTISPRFIKDDIGTYTQNNQLSVSAPGSAWSKYFYTNQTFEREAGKTFSFRYYNGTQNWNMIGWHGNGNTDATRYRNIVYALYFQPAGINIYEDGISRGNFNANIAGGFSENTWYDCKIVLKASGADYFVRKDGQTGYSLLYSSTYSSESDLRLGSTYLRYNSVITDSWHVFNESQIDKVFSLCSGTTNNYTITDAAGCSVAVSATIPSDPPSLNLSASVTNESCPGACDGAVSLSGSGGTAPYTYAGPSILTDQFHGNDEGLILHLPLDNSTEDISPTAQAAGANSGATFPGDGSADFSSSTGISMGAKDAPYLTAATTISYWIYSNNVSSPSRQNPFDQAYGGWGTQTLETNGAISWFFGNNGGNGNSYGSHQSPGGTIVAGQWIHIACTRNPATHTYTWYKNGTQISSGTYNTSYPTINNRTLTIGDGYVNPINGKMSDFRIYNRVLHPDEISELYDRSQQDYIFIKGGASLSHEKGTSVITNNNNAWDVALYTKDTYTRTVGRTLQAQIKTEAGGGTRTMFGWYDGVTTGNLYTNLEYAIYFNLSSLLVYENGSNRGVSAPLTSNAWYDVKIEFTTTGALYYYKLASASSWNLLYTSTYVSPVANLHAGHTPYGTNSVHFDNLNINDPMDEIVDLCDGTYNYTVIDSNGCTYERSFNVGTDGTLSTLPTSATVSSNPICNGSATNLGVSGGSLGTGAAWYWYTGSCGGTLVGSSTTTLSVSPSSTTTYYVRAEGDCNTTTCRSVTVTVNPNPTVNVGGALAAICQGGTSAVMGGSVGGGATGGTWSGGAGTWTNANNPATATYTSSGSESGIVTLTLTTSGGSCGTTSDTKDINVDAVPSADAGTTPQLACLENTLTLDAAAPVVGTGVWTWTTPANVTYVGGTSASDRDAQVEFSASGTYTGTWTVSNGACTPATDNITVEVNNPGNIVMSDATGTCQTNGINDWVHLYNASGNIIASVRDNNQNLGDVTVSVYYHGGNSFSVPANNGQCPGNWQAVLNRSFVINSTIAPSNDVDVRLYFTDAELASLIAQAGCGDPNGCADDDDVCGIGGLYVTQISGASSEDGTFTLGDGNFTLHTPSNGGTGNATFGANYVEISVNGFSEFWIHGSESGVVLPVELLNFTAQGVDNTYIELNWATATEINNEGFEVLRSTDGVNFEPIAFVNGNGNTNTVQNYSYKDASVVKGQTYYYQLKQIDFDGGYEYFDIKSARLDKDNEGIEISGFIPNPAEDKSVIRFSVTKEVRAMVSLYDITGKLVLTQEANLGNGENTISLNTTDLAAGTYNAKIIVGSDVYSRRLMINK